jgi:hypothetical protein
MTTRVLLILTRGTVIFDSWRSTFVVARNIARGIVRVCEFAHAERCAERECGAHRADARESVRRIEARARRDRERDAELRRAVA